MGHHQIEGTAAVCSAAARSSVSPSDPDTRHTNYAAGATSVGLSTTPTG